MNLLNPQGLYDTSDDHETLIVRPRELQDNAVPSGNAMAALVLSRLAGMAVEQILRPSSMRVSPVIVRTRSSRYSYDYTSLFMPFLDIPVSFNHLFERITSIYDCFHLSRLNKLLEKD